MTLGGSSRTSGILVAIVLVLAGSLAFSSCSAPESSDGTLSSEEAQQSYLAEQRRLPLAGSDPWPELEVQQGEFRVAYTRDDILIEAEGTWFCSWEREWLRQYGKGEGKADPALATLRTFLTMDTYTRLTPPDQRGYYDDLLNRAGLGDPTPVRKDQELNCSKVDK